MNKIISSEEYEMTLSLANMKELEDKSDKTMAILNTYEETLSYNTVGDLLPVFVRNYKDSEGKYLIAIKYPTYEIVVLSKKDGSIPEQQDIEVLLQEEKNLIIDYPRREDIYYFRENKSETINVPYIKCMDFNIKNNTEMKNRVVFKLRKAGYKITLYPSIRYVVKEIEYIDKNLDEFKIVHESTCTGSA